MRTSKIFEQRQRHLLWRIQLAEYQGRQRVSVWPFYAGENGNWLPCAARFGGGFQIELARVPELIDTLEAAVAEGGAA